jgi:hypothetical protein
MPAPVGPLSDRRGDTDSTWRTRPLTPLQKIDEKMFAIK